MRFAENTYLHIYIRGHRKQDIFLEPEDWWHAVFMLRYFNDRYSPPNIFRQLNEVWNEMEKFREAENNDRRSLTSTVRKIRKPLIWPPHWPEHRPLVKILNFSFMSNHYHMTLKELGEGNVTKFMRKFNTGLSNYFNTKYNQVGSIFQGKYKSRVIETDEDLMYLNVYIQVKNTFERYPDGGFQRALRKFDEAYEWATDDPFTSLGDYAGKRNSPIIDKDVLGKIFSTPEKHKEFAEQCMLRENLGTKLGQLRIDE